MNVSNVSTVFGERTSSPNGSQMLGKFLPREVLESSTSRQYPQGTTKHWVVNEDLVEQDPSSHGKKEQTTSCLK